jgi:hypothetical protein
MINNLWNNDKFIVDDLHTALPLTISEDIKSLNPCIIPSMEDTWIWNASLNGEYSTRSGYHWLLSQREMESSKETWNWIWKLLVAASVQFFIWQTCHCSIPTKSVLVHRGVNVSPTAHFA